MTLPQSVGAKLTLAVLCLPLVCLGHVRPAAWTGLSPSSFTPVNAANFDGGNRLLIQSSAYDAAGQQTAIGGYTFSYDAEGHMTSSTLAGVTTTYTYDGDGRRITKSTGSSAITYVYDAAGQLAAEYGGTAPATTTQYLTSDHLGSTRVVTSGAQAVVRRYDYFPFGEALRAGAGGRTDAGGYEPSEEPQKLSLRFTGKERDAETGLDYFGARYMSGAQGRFTNPDEPLIDQNPGDPQSWNLYAYVRNNPLRYVDPDGRVCVVGADGRGRDDNNGGQSCADVERADRKIRPSAVVADFAPPSPGLLAVARGTQLAEPGVNLAAQGLMVFGSIFAPVPMALAQCGAGDCSKTGLAMAMLPEIAALKAGGTVLKLGAAAGKGAEIIQKTGGLAQAAKDFAALGGTEAINGGVRIRTLADGTRAVLYTSSSTKEISIQIQQAGRTVSKVRY